MIPATVNDPFQNLSLSLGMESTETGELVDDSAISQMHTVQYKRLWDPQLGDRTHDIEF